MSYYFWFFLGIYLDFDVDIVVNPDCSIDNKFYKVA